MDTGALVNVAMLIAILTCVAPPASADGRSDKTAGEYIGSNVTPPDNATAGGSLAKSSTAGATAAIADRSTRAQYSTRLNALRPEQTSSLRGARDTAIYGKASPAVVLIVAGDSLGSGILISDEGLIATNWHVIAGNSVVGVIFKPATEGAQLESSMVIRARVTRFDQVSDLALVQVSSVPPGIHPIEIGSLASVQIGADVHAIGHPTGEAWTYTRGIVSQIRRNYEWTSEAQLAHRAEVIQTQTPINPGNSGGPLLNDAGQLIGVNSFKSAGEGLNFAVATDTLNRFIQSSGNRMAQSATAPTDECEPRVVRTWHSKDPPPSEMALVDIACDGEANVIVRKPDDPSKPVAMLISSKNDGTVDIVIFDNDRDGNPDVGIYDTNADGKPDLVGYYQAGEDEPYRFEPYKG